MPIRTYRDLEVFRESYAAALEISNISRKMPPLERVELARQLRKAVRSVPANIVEGWAKRNSSAEFRRYLQVTIGLCDEVKLWLAMAKDERYMAEDIFAAQNGRYNRIGAMLASLWRNWQNGGH